MNNKFSPEIGKNRGIIVFPISWPISRTANDDGNQWIGLCTAAKNAVGLC